MGQRPGADGQRRGRLRRVPLDVLDAGGRVRQRRERGQSPSLRRRTSRCRCRFYCWCCCCRDWGQCYCYHRYLFILRILSIIGRRGRAERARVVITGELNAALAWTFMFRASRSVCGSHGEGVRRLFESGRSWRRSSSNERTGWNLSFDNGDDQAAKGRGDCNR
jgi:hypothetical protein